MATYHIIRFGETLRKTFEAASEKEAEAELDLWNAQVRWFDLWVEDLSQRQRVFEEEGGVAFLRARRLTRNTE